MYEESEHYAKSCPPFLPVCHSPHIYRYIYPVCCFRPPSLTARELARHHAAMDDAPPVPSPLSIRQSYGFPRGEEEEDEEEEGEDLLTPLLQSRRPSRQYVSISSPPGDSSLPVFTNPWPCSGILQHRSSAPRVPLVHVRDESPGGRAREARPSVVSEDVVGGLPLTRFPPWTSNSDRERSKSGESAECRCDEGSLRRGVVHAVVLAAQFVAFTGVFCVWVGLAVGEGADHSGFWHKYVYIYTTIVPADPCLSKFANGFFVS